MGCCFHDTAALTTIVGDQSTLAGIKTLVLVGNPLVETAFTQGLALRLFRRLRFPELDNVGHRIDLKCGLNPTDSAC